MTPDQPEPIDPNEILTNRRIGAAFAALADPDDGPTDRLAPPRRTTSGTSIAHALNQSSHPLGGVRPDLLDQWDELDADDRVAGLLLFAEIVNRSPDRQRAVSTGGGTMTDPHAC